MKTEKLKKMLREFEEIEHDRDTLERVTELPGLSLEQLSAIHLHRARLWMQMKAKGDKIADECRWHTKAE